MFGKEWEEDEREGLEDEREGLEDGLRRG